MRSFPVLVFALTLSLPISRSVAQSHLLLVEEGEQSYSLGDPRAQPSRADAPPTQMAERGSETSASSSGGIAIDIDALVRAPIDLGLRARVIAPFGLFAELSFGFTPSGYMESVADVIAGATSLQGGDASLANELGQGGAWNLRIGGGLSLGKFSFGLNYLRIRSDADITGATVRSVFGVPSAIALPDVSIGSTLHALHAHLGIRIPLPMNLGLTLGFGWVHTFSSSVDVNAPGFESRVAEFETDAEGLLTSYGFSPEISVALGARFD